MRHGARTPTVLDIYRAPPNPATASAIATNFTPASATSDSARRVFAARTWSSIARLVRVTMVNVRQMLVHMAERQMPVPAVIQHLDDISAMVNIVAMNRMNVLDRRMRVFMRMFRGRDYHDTAQRHPKRDRDPPGGFLTNEWPGHERSDKRRECEHHLTACCAK